MKLERGKLERCVCFNLRKATRAVTQVYDRALQAADLKVTQFTLLVALNYAGPVPMQRLAEQMGMERTTLTRNLRPMERKKLVEILPGDDLRLRNVSITAKGKRVLEKALPLWEAAQDRLEADVGQGAWDRIRSGLSQVTGKARAMS